MALAATPAATSVHNIPNLEGNCCWLTLEHYRLQYTVP